MCIPINKERYIMFLLPKYFEKSWFESYYNKVKKSLQHKGICVYNIDNSISYIKTNGNLNLSFDEKPYPDSNQLYIHLFNGQYYSDNIYNKKKIEKEREMLFLLAGKLGVKRIEYSTEVSETTITKIQSSVNVKSIENSVNFTKLIKKSQGLSGCEIYENRGAPVYLKFDTLEEVDENIKNRMGTMKSNIFSYDFYKHNGKLESFVYKRFEFKMSKLEYSIESDDISDISFVVKSCFMDWGLNFGWDRNTVFTEKINYVLEFFSDDELNNGFNKINFEKNREKFDPFYIIRETYEAHNDPDTAVHIICEYVMKEATRCYYKEKINGMETIKYFSKLLRTYIRDKKDTDENFEKICHDFRSTSQIRNWMNATLLYSDDCEIFYPDMDTVPINNNEENINNKYSPKMVQRLMYSPQVKTNINNNNSESEQIKLEIEKLETCRKANDWILRREATSAN